MDVITKPSIYKYEFLLLLFFSTLGFISSLGLLLSEMNHLANPNKVLGCDLNPLIGCGSSIDSWQAHLFFGIPNSVIGLCVFTALLTVFILGFIKLAIPKWVWNTLFVGSTLGVLWVFWFLWISIFDFKKLCPFCLILWLSVILIWSALLGIVFRNNFLCAKGPVNLIIASYRFYFALIILLIMFILVLFGMMDVWILLFNS